MAPNFVIRHAMGRSTKIGSIYGSLAIKLLNLKCQLTIKISMKNASTETAVVIVGERHSDNCASSAEIETL